MSADRTTELVGEFAAHLRSGNRHVLVRDPLGVVPLYFGWSADGELQVNADLRAVRAACWDGGIDADHVARLLIQAPAARDRTPFDGVLQVPPGTIVTLSGRQRNDIRYFDSRRLKRHRMEPQVAMSRMRTALEASVNDALAVTDYQGIAAHVSGGLDSTMVAALAQRDLSGRGQGLLAGYGWIGSDVRSADGRSKEHDPALAVSNELGVPLRCVSKSDLAQSQHVATDPLLHPPPTAADYESIVLAKANTDGAQVILSGWGGDEASSVAGTPPFGWMLAQGQFRHAWSEIGSESKRTGRSKPLTMAVAAARPLRLQWQIRRPTTDELQRQWLEVNPSAVRDQRRSYRMKAPPHHRQSWGQLNGHLERRTSSWWLLGQIHGIQYRFPLLDRRVITAACTTPPTILRRDGRPRWLFRELLGELVPAHLVGSKTPEPERVRQHGPLWKPIPAQFHEYYPELDDVVAPAAHLPRPGP